MVPAARPRAQPSGRSSERDHDHHRHPPISELRASSKGRVMTTSPTTSIEPQFRTIDGLRIRYADSGGSKEPVVLLTSPWPESIYAFAPMWAMLAAHAHLFAVDLPGFGASERRADLLSPLTMGEFLARLIVEADLGR